VVTHDSICIYHGDCTDSIQQLAVAEQNMLTSTLQKSGCVMWCFVGAAQAGSEDQHQAWKCMEDAIAISMLLATCQSLHGLETLVIKFQHVGTLHQTVRHHTPRKDPFQDISRIYGHVWFDLQDLLRNSLSLR